MRTAPPASAAHLLISLSLLAWSGCVPVDDDTRSSEEPPPGSVEQALSSVSFRAVTSASGANLSSLAIGKPAGVVAGDLLIARIAGRNNVDAVVTPPAGWTLLRSDQSASQLKSWVLWKVAGSSEPGSYAFGISIASNAAGTIMAFSGADPQNPIDASSGQKNGNTATFTAPAVTTTVADGVAVWFGSQIWTGSACPADGITPPTGFTEPSDTCLVSTSTGLLVDAAYKSLGAAGAQPAWIGSSAFPNTNTAQVVTIRPAGAPSCSAASGYASSYTTVGSFNPDSDAGTYTLLEVSGIAASRVNPGVLYAHSEDNANFVAIDKATAAVLGTYTAAWFPWDWEDIATGPCPAGKCIFMGDIGRASGDPPPQPTTFNVYRMKEPNLAAGETSGTISGDRFPFVYPDTPSDAEALMVHPTTGDIYVVTKNGATGVSKVYKFPQPLPAPNTTSTLILVASLTLPTQPANETQKDPANYRSVTAGAIHPCANRFLLRTYYAVHEYIAPAGGTFESAFSAVPIRRTDTVEGQGEAIEYEADGSGYFTVSERAASPYTLKRVAAQ